MVAGVRNEVQCVDDTTDPALFAIEIPFVLEGRVLVPGEGPPSNLNELLFGLQCG